MVLLFLFWTEEHLKKKKNKKSHKSFCFRKHLFQELKENGSFFSFLNRRTPQEEEKQEQEDKSFCFFVSRMVCFKMVRCCLFQEPLFSSSACFKNRLFQEFKENGSFLFWTEEDLKKKKNKKNHKRRTAQRKQKLLEKKWYLLVQRKEMVLFFFCLFQEPLKEKKRAACFKNR